MTIVDRLREFHPGITTSAAGSSRSRDGLRHRVDWILVCSAIVLAAIGSLSVWSATRPRLLDQGDDPQSYLKRHLLNIVIGCALGAAAALINYRMLRVYTPVIYLASCIGLAGVLVVGSTINGAHSWIVLGGGFQLQPSEFAKVALVMGAALLLTEWRSSEDARPGWDVPLVLLLAAIPMGMIMLQPDLGTIIVFAFTVLALLAVSGLSSRWLVGLAAAGVMIVVVALQVNVLEDYQLDRFRAFTSPEEDTQGASYNITQAHIALANGGLFGTGLFDGSQTNGRFVPEQQTDFIFTVVGEEFGFLGAGGVIALFGILLWRALRIAGRSPDMYGRLVAVGVASWFAFQAFINIGMTLGIMPVTGLPLPLVSYGGSSMFASCIALGLLINVHMRTLDATT